MEVVHPPIVQDATAPLTPEKTVENGIVTERGNIDTRTGIAHALTLTGTKGKGETFIHQNLLQFTECISLSNLTHFPSTHNSNIMLKQLTDL